LEQQYSYLMLCTLLMAIQQSIVLSLCWSLLVHSSSLQLVVGYLTVPRMVLFNPWISHKELSRFSMLLCMYTVVSTGVVTRPMPRANVPGGGLKH